ncbi:MULTISPECIES: autotransporter domain-containing protein [Sphingomonas]|uniref:autotransporter domain-containing protein n=1 Tax=Sphingomonas TaxID=13687 RepID=UPI000DEFDDB2|nr:MULTISPECIES: autotransporter domain-containing protein [Sphingomonas]
MSKFSRALLGASLFGLAALGAATPASAQRVTRIVTFGDSYADTGNLFALTGLNPLTFQNGIYSTGRFSGGTNYIDTLSQILNAPVENFAVGGATAVRGSSSSFDLQFEVDQFLNVGTQSPVLPNGTPSFGPHDLVTVSIGGNDARYFQQGLNNGRTLTDSINATTTQFSRLVGAGAQTISVLAGNTALLPEVATNPTAQATRAAFSTSYNNAVQAQLAGFAANGVMVHYLDLTKVLTSIQTNPTAYGLGNGVVCAPTQANVLSGCKGYLFYVDGLHLSSDGFAVVGQYVAAQLRAPLVLGAPINLQLDTARQFGRTLDNRVDISAARAGAPAEGLHLYITGDGFQRNAKATEQSDRFELRGYGVTVGAEAGLGDSGVVGVAVNYDRDRASVRDGGGLTDKGKTLQAGVYGGVAANGLFVQGHLGYGRTRHNIDRVGVVLPITADPKGHHWVAGAKAGYLADLGGLKVGPFVAANYAKIKLDGYTETGDEALNLSVSRQRAKAFVGNLGLEARTNWDTSGVIVHPFIAASAEKLLSGDAQFVQFAQTASPTIVDTWQLGDRSKKVYGRITGGASAPLGGKASLDVQLGTTVGKKEGNEVNAQLGFKLGF